MNRIACTPTDPACDKFEPKKGKKGDKGGKGARNKQTFILDLNAEIPDKIEPCGFTEDTLTEACWLPYRDQDGALEVRPSIIVHEKGKEPEILDFIVQERIKGTFPSQQLSSLMSVESAKMVKEGATIDPHQIDKEIDEAITKHLDIPQAERILVKRWIEGTYFYDVFDAYPIQNILGVSESGKSRLCLLNLSLCYHAEQSINVTEAGIFRAKEEDKITQIIDEAEYLNNPKLYATLKTLLNASYSKNSGFVSRYDEENGKRVKKRFNLYSPLCISGIGGLSGITLSRSFRVVMKRVNKDFPKADPKKYTKLRDKLYALRVMQCFEIREAYNKLDISSIVSARFEELFKPLFTLTKVFGTEKEWDILAEWCKNYANNFRLEALNVAKEEMVLSAVSKTKPAQPDWYSLKDVADKVMKESGHPITSKRVSSILHRLGITQRRKTYGLIHFYCSDALLEECAARIGLYPCSPNSPNSLSSLNPQTEFNLEATFSQ